MLMETEELTTDQLCDIIVEKVGLPLPTYDYVARKYISAVPVNKPTKNGGVSGSEDYEVHDSFKEACARIILWYELNIGFGDDNGLSKTNKIKAHMFDSWISKKCE
jgi:hypothetical protein